jgi:NadR type nicotinamide-nucleotide adenylyltransferase
MEENAGAPGGMKKIAIVGPESTGKSDLTRALAKHYNTVWVPEYARQYIDNLNRPYEKYDLFKIAIGQIQSEDEQEQKARNFLFCDTNLWVIKIWSDHKYGTCADWILNELKKRVYDLHLLTNIDLPWEEDPQREHPGLREYFFDVYKNELDSAGIDYKIISGHGSDRVDNAISAIETFL